ncbi:hypothetical protein [Sporosarcina sp. BP05]|uniref:phosphorylase family protein n=1 Tax=Sporosarcina sp. BP05 TaxID=2758726 RepID=UPI001646B2B2|nr:hypothetical protein [Sporosarcina sp. BP05]
MIQILLIEDNAEKNSRIKGFVNEAVIDECNFTEINNMSDARKELNEQVFDLMILDIQFLEFIDSTKIREDAGISLLKEIIGSRPNRNSSLKRPSTIIILTEHSSSIDDFNEQFKDTFFKIVKYDGYTDSWQLPLIEAIQHVTAIKKSTLSKSLEHNYDIGIVCALQKELQPILELDLDWSTKRIYKDDSTLYFVAEKFIGNRKIKIVCSTPNQMGITDTTIATMKMIENFKPRYMFMTGITGGVKGKVNIGDIIVADPCYTHEAGKYTIDRFEEDKVKFEPTAVHIRASPNLLTLYQELSYEHKILKGFYEASTYSKPECEPKLIIGPVSSGNAVIANETILNGITEVERRLLGVDMEIYGFARACFLSNIPKPSYLAFKVVSDLADSSKSDDYQEHCTFLSSIILDYIISTYLFRNEG